MTVVRDAVADILDSMSLDDFVNNPEMAGRTTETEPTVVQRAG